MATIQQPGLTQDTVRNMPIQPCDCGGLLFSEKMMFKKMSQIISPTGREEIVPMPIIVCDKCGKVPNFYDVQDIIPPELKPSKLTLNQ